MLTQDFTFAYSDTGVILNSDPLLPTDPFVDISKVSGLDNAEFRISEREREGMDGGFVDSMYEKMRTIVLEGQIYNTTESYLDSLKANYAPSFAVQPFYFDAPGVSERLIYCKSYGMKYDWDTARRLGIVPVQFQLKAEDPTIYGALITAIANLGSIDTGFAFNLSFNFGFGAGGTAGTTTITNSGNKDADGTFTITGPVTNPIIVHDNTGNRLTFSIVLGVSDTLVINLRNKTVTLNGTANRRGSLVTTSRWFMLEPGVNTLRFLGTAGAGTPQMQVAGRSAYR